MYIDDSDNVVRHAPAKKLIFDDYGNAVALAPQAFEMRDHLGEEALSVNWVEYFEGAFHDRLFSLIKAARKCRNIGIESAFGVGNVGRIRQCCANLEHTKVRVLHDKKNKKNPSHARIIRLPMNDQLVMASLASEAFDTLVRDTDVSDE